MDNKLNKIKIVFIGTPEFSVPGLESLFFDEDFEVMAVVSRKDKKVGRKQILCEPAVKIFAKKNGIKIFQPEKIIDIEDELKKLSPDIIVVIAYGQIIPKSILEIPKFACINFHGSLLPKYRGASCVQATILNMDDETGITIMKMDEGLDTGPIIYQESIRLTMDETSDVLYTKLSQLGRTTLPFVLKKYINNELVETKQDNSKASYVKILKKEDGRIDWNQSAQKINAFVRAMDSWPGAYSVVGEQKIKIIKTSTILESENTIPGTMLNVMSKLFVQCSDSLLEVDSIQVAGKKIISGQDFVQGYSRYIGQVLT